MLTIRKGSNATKGNVENLLLSPIVIVVRTPMDIFTNAIVVAPYSVHCLNISYEQRKKELRSLLSTLSSHLRQEEMEPSTASEGLDQSSDRMKSSSVGHPPERLDPGRPEQLR